MTLDVVNAQNEKVASLELDDQVFGGLVKTDLIWQSVVHENAARRRGTHATKNRSAVQGSGRKLWRQKGTGRARVSDVRNPLWRKGGIVFGPTPRSYDYAVSRKVERAALRAALQQKLREGAVTVVDALVLESTSTKAAVALLSRLGASGRTLVVDLAPTEILERSFRNLASAHLVTARHVTPRDVSDAVRLIVTQPALERLQAVVGGAPVARPTTARESDNR